MSIVAGTHLFGSRNGYTTLSHSPDVTALELQELSVLGFGQTSDARFLDSLKIQPSAYGRPLRSGRFAITRCFKGDADDAGRPTLRLCTIVLAAKDYLAVSGALEALLADESVWSTDRFTAGEKVVLPNASAVPERAVTETDLKVLDAWLHCATDPTSLSVLTDDGRSAAALVALPQVLAEEDCLRYRWGMRLLGTAVPADVCTLASIANRSGRRRINIFGNGSAWRHAGVAHLATCLANPLHKLPPVRAIVQRIPSALSDSRDEGLELEIMARRARQRRWLNIPAAVLVGGVLIIGIIIAIGHKPSTPTATDPLDASPIQSSAIPTIAEGTSAAPTETVSQQPAPEGPTQAEIEARLRKKTSRDSDKKDDSENRPASQETPPSTTPQPLSPLNPGIAPAPSPPPAQEPLKPQTTSKVPAKASPREIVGQGLPDIPPEDIAAYFDTWFSPYVEAIKALTDELKNVQYNFDNHERLNHGKENPYTKDLDELKNLQKQWTDVLAKNLKKIIDAVINNIHSQGLLLAVPNEIANDLKALEAKRDSANEYIRRLETIRVACDQLSEFKENPRVPDTKNDLMRSQEGRKARIERLKSPS